jgi:uncharacterized protein YqgC (DUF456 family)
MYCFCSWFYLYDFRVLGSFLPVLPGPTLSWVGLLLLYTVAVPANYWVLGTTLLITIIISVLDFVIPAKGTKKFGSSYGVWGLLLINRWYSCSNPFGFLIGPFIYALIGELIFDLNDHKRALKAAVGSFIGFLASSFMKFILYTVFGIVVDCLAT